jgi:hypothetical protein
MIIPANARKPSVSRAVPEQEAQTPMPLPLPLQRASSSNDRS